jgi:hypothetical protein
MITKFFSNGRYALVDAYYRNIWYNTYNEAVCHKIQQIFWAKMPMLVYDLSTVDQYHEGLIDTLCCLDWQLQEVPWRPMKIGLNVKGRDQTHQGGQLVNVETKYPLSKERQYDLQKQMHLYKTIMDQTHKKLTHNDDMFISKIELIFQTEIRFDDIDQELFLLASHHANNTAWLSGVILTQLDRHYE